MKLYGEDFLRVIEGSPLTSIDLVLLDDARRILMGKRLNQPAQGEWFVPGGRILKGESVSAAMRRISEEELEFTLEREHGRLIDVFDHFYDTNFANAPGIETQYIVLAFAFSVQVDLAALPADQHSEWRWFTEAESGQVHPYSAAYFGALNQGSG